MSTLNLQLRSEKRRWCSFAPSLFLQLVSEQRRWKSHVRLQESEIRLPVLEPEPLSSQWTKPATSSGFCAVTLNLGGRSTNPAEFVLDGDASAAGAATAALGTRSENTI